MKDKNKCQCCKGKGYHEAVLKDLAGRQNHGLGIQAIVPCDVPGCHNGVIDRKANYLSF